MRQALACALLVFAFSAQASEPPPAGGGWAYDVMNELMSPYCPGRLLSDCPSPQAQTLRMWLLVQDSAGRPRAEVEAELLERYGEEILAAPRARGIGLSAYVIPAVAILAGGALLVWFLRRQTRGAAAARPALVAAASAPLDPELERRLDEELDDRG